MILVIKISRLATALIFSILDEIFYVVFIQFGLD